MGKGWHTHRDGGTDPTELLKSARLVIYRPTGACNTGQHHPTQPVMRKFGVSRGAGDGSKLSVVRLALFSL